ncbi:unnamed protein product, partial [Prunus brigantina]
VGVQRDNASPENLKITAQTPTLGVTPYLEPLLFLDLPQKVTGSGQNLIPKSGQNFGLQIELPTLEIVQILPNHQLEHIERIESILYSKKMGAGGVRTSSAKFRQKLSKPPCFVAVSGDHDEAEMGWD